MWLKANGNGIGDAVFLTAVAKEIKQQKGDFVGIVSNWPEIFDNNPDVDCAIKDTNEPVIVFEELHNQKLITEHNVQFMCRKLGLEIPNYENIRQYLYLKNEELVDLDFDYITVHSETGTWTENKSWHYFEELVGLIKANHYIKVIQVGGRKEKFLLNCDDNFLGCNIRKTAALIKRARFHICAVTGTMHLASGVGTKSVVIFGGREEPKITGYFGNLNIQSVLPCSPCWLVSRCPYGIENNGVFHKPCLDAIKPEMVYQQIIGSRII